MPLYRYRAVDGVGRIAKGRAEAANENALAAMLGDTGFEILDAGLAPHFSAFFKMAGNGGAFSLPQFTEQMHDMLKTGIAFADALSILAQSSLRAEMRQTLAALVRSLRQGQGVAVAFAEHPQLFPPVVLAMLRAGEESGDLTATFAQLHAHAASRAMLVAHMRRALRYPLFLLLLAIAVISFMMTLVVPRIVDFLAVVDGDLPLATKWLLAVSGGLMHYGGPALGLITVVIGIFWASRFFVTAAAELWDAMMLRLPIVGGLVRDYNIARFLQTLAALYHNHVGIVASLSAALPTLSNRALQSHMAEGMRHVQAGQPLSAIMLPLLDAADIGLLRVAEYSGDLDQKLGRLAERYEKRATRGAERLIGVIEPALTILMGFMLAWIVLAVLGPLYGGLAHIGVVG